MNREQFACELALGEGVGCGEGVVEEVGDGRGGDVERGGAVGACGRVGET